MGEDMEIIRLSGRDIHILIPAREAGQDIAVVGVAHHPHRSGVT